MFNLFKHLKLRTKFISFFLFLVLVISLVFFVTAQLASSKLREDAIPTLETTSQISDVAKTIQADVWEFVVRGDSGVLERFRQNVDELDLLLERLAERLADDPDEEASFNDLANSIDQISRLGQEVTQAHSQTLQKLEVLEEVETEASIALDEANRVLQAKIIRYIEERDFSQLLADSVPSQQYFSEFVQSVVVTQREVLEFVSSGQEETGYEFEEIILQLIAVKEDLVLVLDEDEPGEAALASSLNNIVTQVESSSREVFEAHTQTLMLLDELARAEEELNRTISSVGFLVAQDISDGTALITRVSIIVSLLILVFSGFSGVIFANALVKPISQLVHAAEQISSGNFAVQVAANTQDELGQLIQTFNAMSQQLQTSSITIERIEQRTQRLLLMTTLSERLSAILDFDQLLIELVNQIRESLGYYHVQVYMIDDERLNLVLAAGTGRAGAEMKARGHNIAVNAPTSLMARAARSGEIVFVANVRKAEDWLPNPLLPDTYAEMAVPIILEGQVVGVLDVQETQTGTLDGGDAALLRALANQVAVAIRNAHLFAEVETALADARAAQARYIESGWNKPKIEAQGAQHMHTRSVNTPPPPEPVLTEAKQLALMYDRPTIAVINGSHGSKQSDETTPALLESIVAPVTLSGKTIGVLQIHQPEGDEVETRLWLDEDLALIESVLDQVAQTAENLRLFEETQERASREQVIREITEKMQTAASVEELIKTTAEELGRRFSLEYAAVELGLGPQELRRDD